MVEYSTITQVFYWGGATGGAALSAYMSGTSYTVIIVYFEVIHPVQECGDCQQM